MIFLNFQWKLADFLEFFAKLPVNYNNFGKAWITLKIALKFGSVIRVFKYTKSILHFTTSSVLHYHLAALTKVKIWISAQRKCRSTKTLSVVQFFMLISLPVLLILRESAISNNLRSKFLVKIWQIIFFDFFQQFHFEIYRL